MVTAVSSGGPRVERGGGDVDRGGRLRPIVATLGGDPTAKPGQSLFSSPAVADVTGDGKAEIVVGSTGSTARVFSLSGALIATLDLGSADPAAERGTIQASPTIGDIDGDGINDVVISNTVGRFAAYSLAGGVPREIYNHLAPQAFSNSGNGLFATSALGYLDRGPQLDVVTASWGQMVRRMVRTYRTERPVSAVSGSRTRSGVPQRSATSTATAKRRSSSAATASAARSSRATGSGSGGFVWAFNLDGSLQWSYFVRDAVVWSSPSLIDLNHDGALDVVVGTGIFFDRAGARRILAIDGRSGQLLWDAATPGRVMGSPAVAMVNGEAWVWVVSEGGALQAWNSAGQQQWSTCIADQSVQLHARNLRRRRNRRREQRRTTRRRGPRRAAPPSRRRADRHDRDHCEIPIPRGAVCLVRNPGGRECQRTDADRRGRGRRRQRQPRHRQWRRHRRDDVDDRNVHSARRRGRRSSRTCLRTSGPLPSRTPLPPIAGVRPPSALLPRVGFTGRRSRRQPHTGRSRQQRLRPARVVRRPRTVRVQRQLRAHQRRPQRRRRPDRQGRQGLLANSPLADVDTWSPTTSAPSAATPYVPAVASGAPDRKVDTRIGLGGGRIPPSGRLCFASSGFPRRRSRRQPHTRRSRRQRLRTARVVRRPTHRSRPTSTTRPPAIDPNVAVAPIGSDGQGLLRQLTARLGPTRRRPPRHHPRATPTSPPSPAAPPTARSTPASASAADVSHRPVRLCFPVSGSPGDAAVVNLTPVGSGRQRFRPARFIGRDRAVRVERELRADQRSTPTSRSHRSAGTDRSAS